MSITPLKLTSALSRSLQSRRRASRQEPAALAAYRQGVGQIGGT